MSTGQGRAIKSCLPLPKGDSSMIRKERRQSVRHACDDGSIRVMVFLGTETCTATLRDISAGGIGVLLDAIVAPGDRLNIELQNSAKGAWHCKTLEVVHALPFKGGRWLVGGAFSQPFSAEELRPLLPARRVAVTRHLTAT
jgi:hypothetical protein